MWKIFSTEYNLISYYCLQEEYLIRQKHVRAKITRATFLGRQKLWSI